MTIDTIHTIRYFDYSLFAIRDYSLFGLSRHRDWSVTINTNVKITCHTVYPTYLQVVSTLKSFLTGFKAGALCDSDAELY